MSETEQTPVADKPASSKPPSSSKPASSKPAAGKRGRPSAGGAKKGAPTSTASKFEVGDIVLSRLKGYPPWPSRIANPDTLPSKVLSKRPSSSSNIYCVQFFPAGDFSWLSNNLIQPLAAHEISAWLGEPHRKSTGGLRDAYLTAQDPSEWDELQLEIQAAKDAADEEVDELEDEEGAESGGKRKRGTGEKKASKKKAKVEKNDKPTSKKEPKSKSEKKAKPESKAADAPNGGEDADPLASNPECVRVKSWRHNLQRAFLSKELPQASEMDSYDKLFSTLENYDGMTIEALQFSKIGKVMKKIAALTDIPRNDELNITSRAQKLMDGWSGIINQNETKTNGHAKEANGDVKPESSAKPPATEAEPKSATEEKETAADVPAPQADQSKEGAEEAAAPAAEPTPA